MKKLTLLLVSGAFLMSQFLHAQAINPNDFLAGSAADANYLGGEYLRPFGNSLAFGLNNGWYNTARTKTGGSFSIMFTPSIIQIPDDQKYFVIDPSKLDQLQLVNPADNRAPTAFGSTEPGPELSYKASPATKIQTPPGSGLSNMIVPMINGTVGLVLNTELAVRFLPKMQIPNLEGTEMSMIGFGVKHDVLQWFAPDDERTWYLAAFAGYTNISVGVDLEEGQNVSLKSNGMTIRGIVSKEFGLLTAYGGVGYNGGSTEIKAIGTFKPVPNDSSYDLVDPVNIVTNDANGIVANAGLLLELFDIIAINVDYTFGSYQSLTAGAGISLNFE